MPAPEPFAPPGYVILRKLGFFREGASDKHLRDVRFILAATATDAGFLEAESRSRGLLELLRRCQPAP